MDGLSRNLKYRSKSNRPQLALRARYRGGEIVVEAKERVAIVAVIVLLVVVVFAVVVAAT